MLQTAQFRSRNVQRYHLLRWTKTQLWCHSGNTLWHHWLHVYKKIHHYYINNLHLLDPYFLDGIGPSGLLVTTAGNLTAEKVFHLDVAALKKNNNWEEGIEMCLKEADRLQFVSIAFPSLGTGIQSIICHISWK